MAEPREPAQLGDWLQSMGAPESLAGMLPKEVRELDVTSVLRVLGGLSTSSAEQQDEKPAIEGSGIADSSELEPGRSIHWLPKVRD